MIIKAGGEMVSTCGVHLGHNLPDSKGDRYCINMVCMAGTSNGNATAEEGPLGTPLKNAAGAVRAPWAAPLLSLAFLCFTMLFFLAGGI